MRWREVGRVHGDGGAALELHGEHRGAGGLDNRLAHRLPKRGYRDTISIVPECLNCCPAGWGTWRSRRDEAAEPLRVGFDCNGIACPTAGAPPIGPGQKQDN